jgi:hypothetical protein
MIVLYWLWSNWTFNTSPLDWWVWVLMAMAAWRWASFLVNEEGPFGVFMWLRRKRGIFQMPNGAGIAPGFTAFVCVKCMSVWCVLWLIWLPWQVSLFFALSTGAILMARAL